MSAIGSPFSTIIRVDRSVSAHYPRWVKRVIHHDTERAGPPVYHLGGVHCWLHEQQSYQEGVSGVRIYIRLRETEIFRDCLSLRDGEEICPKGAKAFRSHFGPRTVVLWKSLVERHDGEQFVPFMYELLDAVNIDWCPIRSPFFAHYPAARFLR